jgi:single-strand DNA-binding protein
MTDLNHVVLIGRLTRDAELKYTAGGQAVCEFSLAVNWRRKNGDQWVDEVNFFDVVLWGRSGEAINQYLLKGKQIAVDGELRQDRWDQDGQKRSKVKIMANNVQLLGGGAGAGGGGNAPAGGFVPRERSNGSTSKPAVNQAPEDSGDDGFADDIPF